MRFTRTLFQAITKVQKKTDISIVNEKSKN